MIDLSAITDRSLLRGIEYWRGKAAGRAMPDRRDLDPTEIPDLLPWIVLWDVIPGSYRIRLAGTAICQAHGRELRGINFETLHGTGTATIKPEYDYVVRESLPHFAERTMWWYHRDYRAYRHVLLPFTNSGDDCALIMSVTAYV